MLPLSYEMIFADGPHMCEPAPGIEGLFPGPYRCWYNTPTTSKVAKALEFIRQVVNRDGPFDGVLGFSQVNLNQPPLEELGGD